MNKEKFSVFHLEQNTVQKSCISFHFWKVIPFEKAFTWNLLWFIWSCVALFEVPRFNKRDTYTILGHSKMTSMTMTSFLNDNGAGMSH